MTTHPDRQDELVQKIKHLKSELGVLEKELSSLIQQKESEKPADPGESKREGTQGLVLLIVASIAIVLFIFSGQVITPDVSKVHLNQGKTPAAQSPNAPAQTKLPQEKNCARFNGDFDACVNGQKAGNGCSWYADCRKCIQDTDRNLPNICP